MLSKSRLSITLFNLNELRNLYLRLILEIIQHVQAFFHQLNLLIETISKARIQDLSKNISNGNCESQITKQYFFSLTEGHISCDRNRYCSFAAGLFCRQFQQHIPGGYSCEFLVRVCRPVLQILTLFQTQKCSSTPVFRPGLQAEIMSSLLRLERKNKLKIFQIHFFEFPYFSFFLSTHLELKR